jgi:hypothetical protein
MPDTAQPDSTCSTLYAISTIAFVWHFAAGAQDVPGRHARQPLWLTDGQLLAGGRAAGQCQQGGMGITGQH